MRKNLPIIVAIVLPILVVIGVLLSIYIPAANIQPEYNIVFASQDPRAIGGGNEYLYIVQDQKIEQKELSNVESVGFRYIEPRLYVYDFDNETVTEISYTQAESLEIIKSGNVSPDGYVVSHNKSEGNIGIFEIFGGYSRDYGWRVTKDGQSIFKKMDGAAVDYYWNLEILGWIKQ